MLDLQCYWQAVQVLPLAGKVLETSLHAGARLVIKFLARLPGVAPRTFPRWNILLFKPQPQNERARSCSLRALVYYNKEQTPLRLVYSVATGISWWTFRCFGHTSSEALRL